MIDDQAVRSMLGLGRGLDQSRVRETPLTSSGTAFPSGPATGMRFFRSDLGLECYYDGTRWLTLNEYECILTTSEAQAASFNATTVNVRNGAMRSDYAAYITRAQFYIFCGLTNNGANYFTYTTVDHLGNTIWSFNTSADTANANNAHNASTGAFTQPPGATFQLQLNMTVSVGAPSAQFPRAPVFYYRLIIT